MTMLSFLGNRTGFVQQTVRTISGVPEPATAAAAKQYIFFIFGFSVNKLGMGLSLNFMAFFTLLSFHF